MINELKANWKWILVIVVFIAIYGDKYLDNRKHDQLIEEIMDRHEQDKRDLNIEIAKVSDTLEVLKGKDKVLKRRYDSIAKSVNEIRNERIETQADIPNYSDRKLDSILTNYRHR